MTCVPPWCKQNGWLGIKNQLPTYYLAIQSCVSFCETLHCRYCAIAVFIISCLSLFSPPIRCLDWQRDVLPGQFPTQWRESNSDVESGTSRFVHTLLIPKWQIFFLKWCETTFFKSLCFYDLMNMNMILWWVTVSNRLSGIPLGLSAICVFHWLLVDLSVWVKMYSPESVTY